MSSYYVTQCVCHHKTFVEIEAFAKFMGFSTVDELRDADFCCQKCKMCEPYIEMALKTGKTKFIPGAFANQKKNA